MKKSAVCGKKYETKYTKQKYCPACHYTKQKYCPACHAAQAHFPLIGEDIQF